MNSILAGVIGVAMVFEANMKVMQEEHKDRILQQWEDSKKMPRKMKKKIRKQLLLEWSIACFDPLEGLNFN